VNKNQLGILFGKIKLLNHSRQIFFQTQGCGKNGIFHSIFERSPNQIFIQQKLEFVKQMLLRLFSQKSVWIRRMLFDLCPVDLSVF
jgi:hypothetical protein